MEGIEPTTPRLQITCSGQLSYIGNIVVLFQRERKYTNFSENASILVIIFAKFHQFRDIRSVMHTVPCIITSSRYPLINVFAYICSVSHNCLCQHFPESRFPETGAVPFRKVLIDKD